MRRYSINNYVFSGQAASTAEDAVHQYLSEFEHIIEEGGYMPQQVFTCDETALYWKLMPHRTYLEKEQERIPGYMVAKERVLLLFCSNVTGDLKPKPAATYRLS